MNGCLLIMVNCYFEYFTLFYRILIPWFNLLFYFHPQHETGRDDGMMGSARALKNSSATASSGRNLKSEKRSHTLISSVLGKLWNDNKQERGPILKTKLEGLFEHITYQGNWFLFCYTLWRTFYIQRHRKSDITITCYTIIQYIKTYILEGI